MSSGNPLFAYIHPAVVPLENAFLHVSDLAIQRGYGVFDYFKILRGRPVFLEDYLNRFYASAALMELPVPLSREALREVIFGLIGRNKQEASGLKMILTGGYSSSGYEPAGPNLIITQQPLPLLAPAQLRNGISIITHSYIREIPEAKTINYTMGIRLIRQIREKGADDVLYYQEGVVTEFPRSNFFIVKQDNTVVTPAEGVLAGITRKKVLQLAAQSYRAEAAPVRLEDILSASEAFMTSTTKRILPVVQVDGRMISTGKPGPVTLALLEKLARLEEESPE